MYPLRRSLVYISDLHYPTVGTAGLQTIDTLRAQGTPEHKLHDTVQAGAGKGRPRHQGRPPIGIELADYCTTDLQFAAEHGNLRRMGFTQ